MRVIYNIWTVAAYERKTLFRSWFFRIFAILSLLILFGINMGFFGTPSESRWTTRAIAANIPYINILFMNVAQAVIAIFLASEFIKRDRKLDTTEVIYTRPISNGEYVIGKTLGIIILFLGLVLITLLMALLFNLVRMDTPVVWEAYVYYPLLIAVPTLVFILGLAFFLMILLRSQAVTFVLLLGYIGLTLFYFKGKQHGLLDYMAFNLPMVYSDFIHFASPRIILFHRLAYLFLGIGFIFGTIRFLGRLPQTGRWNEINLAGFMLFLSVGLFFGYSYFKNFHNEARDRRQYLELNNLYAERLFGDIVSNNIELSQHGRRLEVVSEIVLQNRSEKMLDTLIFSLNPGFNIDSITDRNGPVAFNRNKQIIEILPEQSLEPGRRSRVKICYSGLPDLSIANLDIPDKQIQALKSIQVAKLDKKPGFISRDYLLLTENLLWHPVSGVGFNQKTFLPVPIDFADFSLTVHPNKGMVPVSQGSMQNEDDTYIFKPDQDMDALSLIIGLFEKRSIEVGGKEYNLFIKPGHDYFSSYFTHISDTLSYIIKSEQDDYEREELDLYYPFKRVNLVEVPIQFHAYERPYIQSTEYIQPEMILITEKGAGLGTFDFTRSVITVQGRTPNRNEARSDKEIEIDRLKRLLRGTFFGNDLSTRPAFGGRGFRGDQVINFQGDLNYTTNPFSVFPLYYSYMTGISSYDYPVFNTMIEIYLREGFEVSPRQSFTGGMSDNERANLALKDQSLLDILSRPGSDLINATLRQAGSFIVLAIKNRVGSRDFDNFLYYYIEDHAFTTISFNRFASDFFNEFQVDIRPYLELIHNSGGLPEFQLTTPEYIQSRDNIGEVYLIRFRIRNTGNAKGMVEVTMRMPGQGGFGGGGGGMETENRLYELDPGITKDIQITVFDVPRMVTINTLVSANIPSSFSTFLRSAEVNNNAEIGEYERISDEPIEKGVTGEYVVDNEDPGFRYISVSNESKLKQFLDARKEDSKQISYESINPYRIPAKWTPVAHTALYGQSIRSAMVCAAGDGKNKAIWTTFLPESGFYDVYVYIPLPAMFRRPSGRGRGGNNPDQGGGERMQGGPGRQGGSMFGDRGFDYHYVISSPAGSEDVEFILDNIEDGWNKIGTFYFPADSASVELSNKTGGNRVFADAVKWVKKPG